MVVGPKPLFNHTRWCGCGKHAKRALEEGGSCAQLLVTHPRLSFVGCACVCLCLLRGHVRSAHGPLDLGQGRCVVLTLVWCGHMFAVCGVRCVALNAELVGSCSAFVGVALWGIFGLFVACGALNPGFCTCVACLCLLAVACLLFIISLLFLGFGVFCFRV